MLDVHPPHEPIHGWREFLLHLLTITVGLLIALALEATAEAVHHHHLAAEARENIRAEIGRNRTLVDTDVASVRKAAALMKADVAAARARRDHPGTPPADDLHFELDWSSFNDSAWRTARDTGALAFMPASEVQRYADAYGQQAIANEQAASIYANQAEVAAPLLMEPAGAELKPEDLHVLMMRSAEASLRLQVLAQIVGELKSDYSDALTQP